MVVTQGCLLVTDRMVTVTSRVMVTRVPVSDMYKGFVSQGEVSDVMDGCQKNPVTILRDTGASQSLMLSSVSPESTDGEVGAKALIQGIDGSYVPVPLRRVVLKSGVVSGIVTVGVVPSLPIDGVDFLLGNDLAGDKVRCHASTCRCSSGAG